MVKFSNCPLLWVSRLHSKIVLSKLHPEYVALSRSVRALLPLRSIIKEVIYNLGIDIEKLDSVSSSTEFPVYYQTGNFLLTVDLISYVRITKLCLWLPT